MESNEKEKQKKRCKKQLKKDSMAYLRQREKGNARKRKFLSKMTAEQREIKKAKDRAYYQKKKDEKKVKSVSDMTEREKRKKRKAWKDASKKYRSKKKALINVIDNTPPPSDDEFARMPRNPQERVGRRLVRKDKAKAYRTIKRQEGMIAQMRRNIERLKKKLQRSKANKKEGNAVTPNSKVNELIKDIIVPTEVRKRLLFGEVLSSQLKKKAETLKKNSKERRAFQNSITGTDLRKYRLLHMAKPFLPKEKNNKSILTSETKIRETVLKPEIREMVKEFFERDDVSRMCPAKRDSVKKNGIRKQKRVLLATVKALTPVFVKETGIDLPYSTLLRAKPFWVVAPKQRDRETCLCVKHDNFELKLNKLNIKESTEEFIKKYSCDVTAHNCMSDLCDTCKTFAFEAENSEDTVTYFQWQSTNEEKIVKGEKKTFKITKKVPILSTMRQLRQALVEDIPMMKKHLYGIYSYNKQKKELKEKLTENELLIQIDFSENFTTKYASEIQSTHFAKNQLSIHTGVCYSRNDDQTLKVTSFATVSENLDHQAYAVWAHLRPILTELLENKKVDTLHVYSDGPTSQYRNRTNIFLWIKTLINEFQQISKSTWTYSEPGHGKGPMDGIGGVLKRTADQQVLMGKDIKTAPEFVSLFTTSHIIVKEVLDVSITSMKETIPKTLDAIPGIMNMTEIIWQKGLEVTIKLYRYRRFQKEIRLSMFPNNVDPMDDVSLVDEHFMEEDNLFRRLLPELTKRKHIYKTIYNSSSSDEENLSTVSIRQKVGQKGDSAAGTSYGKPGKENLHPNLISPGTFLLIKVPTDKKNVMYRYVAKCQTCVEDDGEVKVTFLRSIRNSAKVFKLEPKDVSYVNYEQIVEVVPMPSLKREKCRDYYYFATDIDIFEK